MVNWSDNDSSFASFDSIGSFADYWLDDSIARSNNDGDDSSSSEDYLSHHMLGVGGGEKGIFDYDGLDLLDETNSNGVMDDLFVTTDHCPTRQRPTMEKQETTVIRGGQQQHCASAVKKKVQFGSEEIWYFTVLVDGRTQVTARILQVLPVEFASSPAAQKNKVVVVDRWCSSFISSAAATATTPSCGQTTQRPPRLCRPLQLVKRAAST